MRLLRSVALAIGLVGPAVAFAQDLGVTLPPPPLPHEEPAPLSAEDSEVLENLELLEQLESVDDLELLLEMAEGEEERG